MNKFKVLKEICEEHAVGLVYLFGSQAQAGLKLLQGEELPPADPMTDVDVGLVFITGLREPRYRYRLYAELYNSLEDLFRPYPLDLVFLQENHSVFQAEALTGKCIYAVSETFREEYELRILARAADFRPILERFLAERLEEI